MISHYHYTIIHLYIYTFCSPKKRSIDLLTFLKICKFVRQKKGGRPTSQSSIEHIQPHIATNDLPTTQT